MANIQKITTPRGLLEWVTITGEGKENLSGKMKYTASIVLPADNPIFDKIRAFWNDNKPAGFKKDAKSLGIYPHSIATDEVDEEGNKIYDEDPDNLVLRFSTDTTFPDGKAKVIGIYNAKGRKVALPEGTMVGNGTEGCIAGAMGIYENKKNGKVLDAGVTLYLNDLQIIKLVEYSQDAGFEAQDDDGWSGEDDSWAGATEEKSEENTAKPRL